MFDINDISPEGYSSPLLPFTTPSQRLDDAKDHEQTLSQLPLLKKVVKRLDDRIADSNSIIRAIEVAKKYDISRDNALVALDTVRQQLEDERGYIQTCINRATR